MRYAIFSISIMLIFLVSSHADTIHVPADQPTIQAGIDAAVDGDTVLVAPGTYVENIDYSSKQVIVESENGPDETVIDGNQAGSVVTFKNGEGPDAVLRGFTITNGKAPIGNYNGGGIHCNSSSPTIEQNIIAFNDAFYCGGGIHCYNSSASITKNNIHSNTGYSGAGVSLDACTLEFTGNTIHDNITSNSGGGILCKNSSVSITNDMIQANTASSGAGIACFDSVLIVSHNTIACNSAVLGGGIYIYETDLVVMSNEFSSNEASTHGGGIWVSSHAPLTISANIFFDNRADAAGGGIICGDDSIPVISDNLFIENHASSGAGVSCLRCFPHITANHFIDNDSWWGGGIYSNGSTLVITNNIISTNYSGFGGGIYLWGSITIITNNTIHGNEAAVKGGGIYTEYSNDTITNSILWNNRSANGNELYVASSTVDFSYNDVSDSYWADFPECFNEEPCFVDSDYHDFHIRYFSLCRDTGDLNAMSLPTVDSEGDSRMPRLISSGGVDIGADEFYTHLYVTGNQTPGGDIQGKLVGLPGTTPVGLVFGSGVLEPPLPTMWGHFHLQAPWIMIPLVPIPADGVLVLPATIPVTPPAPYDLPMQALIGLNSDSLTNLFVLEVR
jgi:hypothetical protein